MNCGLFSKSNPLSLSFTLSTGMGKQEKKTIDDENDGFVRRPNDVTRRRRRRALADSATKE